MPAQNRPLQPTPPLAQAEAWGQTPAPSPGLPMLVSKPDAPLPAVARGSLVVLRQFDIADEIHLDRVQALLESQRSPLREVKSSGLVLSNPPVAVSLGTHAIELDGRSFDVEVVARLFDFGAVSLRLRFQLPEGMPWEALSSLALAAQTDERLTRIARDVSLQLERQIAPALDGAHASDVFEDYVVVAVERFVLPDGQAFLPTQLPLDAVAKLLLGERGDVTLALAEVEEATQHRASYYGDDLFVANWASALVVEPSGESMPVDVLELANAQLLELRYFDALLDRELGRLYDEVAARRGKRLKLFRAYGPVLRRTMALLLDLAEFVERAENALKVFGDVYPARLYAAAVDTLRIPAWERAVTRKQGLLQQVYDMLKSEVDASRDQLLELTIVLLIIGEMLLALGHVTG